MYSTQNFEELRFGEPSAPDQKLKNACTDTIFCDWMKKLLRKNKIQVELSEVPNGSIVSPWLSFI